MQPLAKDYIIQAIRRRQMDMHEALVLVVVLFVFNKCLFLHNEYTL